MVAFSFSNVFGQELQLATFQEMAQIIIDQQISKNVTASITLQSISNQEMKIPSELENRILSDEHVISVVITNEEKCITGVIGESCILINVKRDESWKVASCSSCPKIFEKLKANMPAIERKMIILYTKWSFLI